MEPLREAIFLGMVSDGQVQLGSEVVREILPELGRELGSSVRGDIGGEAITSNPTTQEGISHIFGIFGSQGNCFWPASDSVYRCKEECETLGAREWPYKIHIHMVEMECGLIVLDSVAWCWTLILACWQVVYDLAHSPNYQSRLCQILVGYQFAG